MREVSRWTVTIAQPTGVPVRVHMYFWLFAVWTLYSAWLCEQSPGDKGNLIGAASGCLGILAASVFWHELSHWWAARWLGGSMRALVLGPFGGLGAIDPPDRPRDEMLVHLAGPAANAVAAVVAASGLALMGEYDVDLLHPMLPTMIVEGTRPLVAMKLVLWINWVLLLLNLIPGFPFDGGRILRAALLWRSPHLGRREAALAVSRFARLVAGLIILVAVLAWRQEDEIGGAWFALGVLAIFVFFGAEHDICESQEREVLLVLPRSTSALAADHERQPAHQDFMPTARNMPESYAPSFESGPDLEEHAIGTPTVAPRATERRYRDDDALVDAILTRVFEVGIDGLSTSERAVLEQASKRYRQRRQAGTTVG